MFTYTFQTPDHGYDFIPDPLDANVVRVKSEFKDSLEEFLATLELAGITEYPNESELETIMRFQNLTIEESDNDYDHFYYIDIEKSDLALFLQFEILNYMGAAFNGS